MLNPASCRRQGNRVRSVLDNKQRGLKPCPSRSLGEERRKFFRSFGKLQESLPVLRGKGFLGGVEGRCKLLGIFASVRDVRKVYRSSLNRLVHLCYEDAVGRALQPVPNGTTPALVTKRCFKQERPAGHFEPRQCGRLQISGKGDL